ncbi:hypothetical protein, partial [Akkermansia sp.]|uniref:hypothetical protein n=1 Tax=Akkermansia sp. TaxID=1872421 RepID=UPI003AB86B1D
KRGKTFSISPPFTFSEELPCVIQKRNRRKTLFWYRDDTKLTMSAGDWTPPPDGFRPPGLNA